MKISLLRKYFIFVIFPLLIAFLNSYFSNFKNFRWGYQHINQINFTAIGIGMTAAIWIAYENYISGKRSRFWYIFVSINFLLLGTFLYLGYTFSHFGF